MKIEKLKLISHYTEKELSRMYYDKINEILEYLADKDEHNDKEASLTQCSDKEFNKRLKEMEEISKRANELDNKKEEPDEIVVNKEKNRITLLSSGNIIKTYEIINKEPKSDCCGKRIEYNNETNKFYCGKCYKNCNQTPSKPKWKPDGRYFYINTDGAIEEGHWDNHEFDEDRYEFGNCFKTEAEAQEMAVRIRKLLLDN